MLLGGAQPPVLEVGEQLLVDVGRAGLAAAQHDGRRCGQGAVADAAARRRAACLSRLARVCRPASCGAMPLRNRDGRRPCRAAGIARQRPAERQMHSRPGDSDVEQPALLLDGLAVGAVRQRVRDGQRAVGEADEEHRVPLQTLGRVQRGQRDALHHRWVPRVGALPQLGQQRTQVELRAAAPPRRRRVRPARPAPPTAPGPWCPTAARRSGPAARAVARTNGGRSRPARRRRARRRAAAPAAPAGSPGG